MGGGRNVRFSDRLGKEIGEKKDSKKQLQELFNDSAYSLIQDFMKNVQAGDIRIDNTADLMRLMQIYQEVNNIDDGGGSGALPTMRKAERDVFDDFIETEIDKNADGEEEYYVKNEDLEKLDEKEIEELMNKRAETLNQLNEEAF